MNEILNALLALCARNNLTVTQATLIVNRLWWVAGAVVLALVWAFGMNALWDVKALSHILAVIFALALVCLWTRPLYILIIAGAGVLHGVLSNATLAAGIEAALRKYLDCLKIVLLVGISFLFVTGTLSFQTNPKAMLLAITALMVIGLFMWVRKDLFKGVLGWKIAYYSAVFVLVTSLGSIVFPGATWVKFIGLDPTTVGTNETEEALYRLDRALANTQDAQWAAWVAEIAEKVEKGEPVTDADVAFVERARLANLNLPQSVAQTVAGIDPTTNDVLTFSSQYRYTIIIGVVLLSIVLLIGGSALKLKGMGNVVSLLWLGTFLLLWALPTYFKEMDKPMSYGPPTSLLAQASGSCRDVSVDETSECDIKTSLAKMALAIKPGTGTIQKLCVEPTPHFEKKDKDRNGETIWLVWADQETTIRYRGYRDTVDCNLVTL